MKEEVDEYLWFSFNSETPFIVLKDYGHSLAFETNNKTEEWM